MYWLGILMLMIFYPFYILDDNATSNELVKCILSIMEVDSSLHFDIYWNAILSCGSFRGINFCTWALYWDPHLLIISNLHIKNLILSIMLNFVFAKIERWASMLLSTDTSSFLLGTQVILLNISFSFCLSSFYLLYMLYGIHTTVVFFYYQGKALASFSL